MKPLLRFFVFMSRAAFVKNGNKAPRQLYVAADEVENGMPN
ncbi:hypothetical protein ALQ93_101486 [Pseudomonas syringae pv. pisi]|jgi:hypothetical protein|uniref:Uncharacterized protein n=6 Tax=Pseudomonas syringae group TaxID=136849 RepID=F3G2X2_PSESJ|nr:hypothetical protein PSYJA_14857 [Pseudomonas syringae pv. japonica str. M301072]EGH41422.1 hypothetical protein PSYPI_02902 [Pseudomonas syringae pv. pisi str. 1704B]KPX66874.1 hypothetical protein ALO39_101329 [Pseudomonas syringae pv. lapsa]KPY70523.1 hypothetical protein ALO45_101284 [Pseudomonas syringae pv. syringae]RML35803.1 hypothetical protein ALQ96_101316 [Pseudomonas syringae pv. atrofaciens]RML60484.1 hypothetical protein ALQ93_101486 [Pseudomonas syringae pv. pisi]RMR92291.1 